MEDYINISYLNDFIFCPRSIYFHNLYSNFQSLLYKQTPQLEGENAHSKITDRKYSSSKHILQDIYIYCAKYKLCGKIDVLDTSKRLLIERKRQIKTIYDGYIFQVYAQYFCLIEMGYKVSKITLYDYSRNKNYPVDLPENNLDMFLKFEKLIQEIKDYSLENTTYKYNIQKCQMCIYNQLCDASLC